MRALLFTMLSATLPLNNCIQGIIDDLPGPDVCTLEFAYGVSAEVTDAESGAAITSAVLTLTDGNYSEVMESFPTGDYVGAGERAGTYTLTAQATGYQTRTIENIVVTAGRCHVNGVRVEVQLQPVD